MQYFLRGISYNYMKPKQAAPGGGGWSCTAECLACGADGKAQYRQIQWEGHRSSHVSNNSSNVSLPSAIRSLKSV